MPRYFPVVLLILVSQVDVHGQENIFRQAEATWAKENYRAYVPFGTRMLRVSRTPVTLTRLAQAHAHNGDSVAWTYLDELARKGLVFDLDTMKEFAALNDEKRHAEFVKKFRANMVADRSDTAFVIRDPTLIPEGIAAGHSKRRFYLSSYVQAKVIKVLRKGKHSDFVSTGQNGLLGTLGMKVDTKKKELLVCSSQDFPIRKGTSGVFVFKLNGLFKRVLLPGPGDHLVNDLAIDNNSKLYVTDSRAGSVLFSEGDSLKTFVTNFIYPNGIAIDDSNEYLFVADYTGLTSINIKTKERVKMGDPANHSLEGIDGLYYYKGDLIAIQNGIGSDRIVRIKLSNGNKVNSVDVLQLARRDFAVPTTGVIVKNSFYYVANSYVTSLKEDGTIPPQKVSMDPIILKLPLN